MATSNSYPFLLFVFLLVVVEISCDYQGRMEEGEDGENEKISRNRDGEPLIGSTRRKRYPEHLDPNSNYPFWVRMGECPTSLDGVKKHFCPSPTPGGRWICVDDYQLCDGVKNCPGAEDEASNYCLFYRVLKSEVELLTRSIAALGNEIQPQGGRREENDMIFEIDENNEDMDNKVGVPEEAFVTRFHRQSGRGQFLPVN